MTYICCTDLTPLGRGLGEKTPSVSEKVALLLKALPFVAIHASRVRDKIFAQRTDPPRLAIR
jgi:hypothetical protein